MRASVKVFALACVASLVLLIGVKQGWFHRPPSPSPVPPADPPTETQPPAPAFDPNTSEPLVASARPRPTPPKEAAPPAPETAPAPTQTLDDIIGSEAPNEQKVQQLLALLPRLPEADQPEAAQHLSNLLPDEAYASVSGMLTNAQTPAAVLDVLLTDVLNRKDSLKLPMLLQVAQQADHPHHEEAKDILQVYVENDFGTDWPAWGSAVEKWLKENPEE